MRASFCCIMACQLGYLSTWIALWCSITEERVVPAGPEWLYFILTQRAVQVLLLLPMRHLARRAVLRLCQLAQEETRSDSVQGKARFLEESGDEPLSGEVSCTADLASCRC